MTTENQAVPFDLDAIGVMANGTANRYYLLGGKCRLCGKLFFPKREVCPLCFDQGNVEGVALDPRGTVVSYTVVRRAPNRKVPYAFGYVKNLDGLLVFASLAARDVEQFRVGMAVECVFKEQQERDGERWIVYEFRPVEEVDGKGETK